MKCVCIIHEENNNYALGNMIDVRFVVMGFILAVVGIPKAHYS